MADKQTTNVNNEDLWQDGAPIKGIKITAVITTGDEKYWVDGTPIKELFPKGNMDTGKFFLIFEEG